MAETIPVRQRREQAADRIAKLPKPAKHLSRESKALFNSIVGSWILGVDGLAILRGAMEFKDAYEVCRREVLRDGPSFRTEGGQLKAHPSAKLALDNFASFRQALRQLGLDPEKGL